MGKNIAIFWLVQALLAAVAIWAVSCGNPKSTSDWLVGMIVTGLWGFLAATIMAAIVFSEEEEKLRDEIDRLEADCRPSLPAGWEYA